MAQRTAITDEWVAAAASSRPFGVAGNWGAASGIVVQPPARGGLFRRASRQAAAPAVALVAPQWPGLPEADRAALVDDALCAGLLRGGVAVARVTALDFAGPADVGAWIDAIGDAFAAVSADAPRAGLAGSWFAGTACAVLAGRLPSLAFLACAGSPSAEVMGRRTPENEDDPVWETSPTLRLADALAALAPLEAVTVHARPSLFVQGAVGDPIGTEHLEAWRASLAATGRPADAVEVAFTDALFAPVAAPGDIVGEPDGGRALLAAAVASWAERAFSRPAVRRGR
jgi:hypothetical protein